MFGFGINTAYAAESSIHVALKPYIVGHVFGMPITATLLTTWLTMIILMVVALMVRGRLAAVPGKLQSVFELILGGIYDYMTSVLESRTLARKYFPVVSTIFLFVLGLNWVGLLPGVTAFGFTFFICIIF